MQGRERRKTKRFAFRLRELERDRLRIAARKAGQWDSELAREAINDRVSDILGNGSDHVDVIEAGVGR